MIKKHGTSWNAYGKFFDKKAAFISREWWPDFCNWRRSVFPRPEEGSIEDAILQTLQENGSMITRDLRKACGFMGTKMRSKFDAYITLEMGAILSRKILFTRKAGMGTIMVGAGRCSLPPKLSWVKTTVIPTALPKSHAGGWRYTFKAYFRMGTNACRTSS